MEVVLSRDGDTWLAVVGERHYHLNPTSVPLEAVATAIKEIYPRALVRISPDISENPWIKGRIQGASWEYFAPYREISRALQHPQIKYCRCGGTAYFDGGINEYRCTECYRTESFIDRWRYFRSPYN